MINYPNKPWTNGQQFEYTNAGGEKIVGSYSELRNAWSFTRVSNLDARINALEARILQIETAQAQSNGEY